MNPTGYPQVFDELTYGAVTRTYTYGLQRIDEEQVIDSAWTPSFYGFDGFGTVRQLTSLTGAVTDSYQFDAFGNEITRTGTTPNNYLYRGEQYDSDLGLYYLRARYYNPLTGRFMSKDPANGNPYDPKSLHRYQYAGGDPVNAVDRTGKDFIEDWAGMSFDEIVEWGAKTRVDKATAESFCLGAAAVYATDNPAAIVWEIELMERLCMSLMVFSRWRKMDSETDIFERYTPEARRSVFFAGSIARQLGSRAVDGPHLLLGIARENIDLLNRFLSLSVSENDLQSELANGVFASDARFIAERPFSSECERVFSLAGEEAIRMSQHEVGIEHLLLGLLREQNSMAARVLRERGANVARIREELLTYPHQPPPKKERKRREMENLRKIIADAPKLGPGRSGVPGKFCTRWNETDWYERSLRWHEGRSTRRSRS